ncbi:MAG: peptidoglycan-binding protein [Acidobacteriia bacterium]|nr:peptidoglycan-binding protein [Terriglobia bacterium]
MSVISASVGKFDHGARQCHNIPSDQSIVISLLNRVGRAQGGRREDPLPNNPRWGVASPALYEAILTFQRTNRLSVDGHVDPGEATLRRLDELAAGPLLPTVRTDDLPESIRRNPDYVERRVQGVGILGLGGPFRMDIGLDANMMPTRSFFMDRSRFNLVSDPFTGNAEIALTGIYPSETQALAAVRGSGLNRTGYVVYAHYRGAENIIFPTIMSATTTPALIRALRLAVDDEARYAQAASNLLIRAFFTLAGLRYLPVAAEASAPAAAGDLQALRQTAQALLRNQPAGRAVVNLAGTGEVSGAINVNVLSAQQVSSVPNLIRSGAETVGEIFPRASVDRIVSNDVVFGQVNWATTARGCFTILRPGGTVSIAPYAGQLAEHLEAIATALRSAGFRDVAIEAGHIVTAVRP